MKKCIVCGGEMKIFIANLFDDRYGSPGLYSIYRCANCGFGRTSPILDKNTSGEFYKKYYPLSSLSPGEVKSSVRIWPNFFSWLAGIDNTAHRHIKSNSDVLDIGSGSGTSLLEIKKMRSRAFGVEPDPSAQNLAKKLGLVVIKGFISKNIFPGKRFDYITASQVFEHETDPLRFLETAKNKLKVKGQIILGVPNFDSIYRKIFGRKWLNWHVPYHIDFFTKKSLRFLAKKTGLKLVTLRTITPNIWTVFQVRNIFINSHERERNPLWSNKPGGIFLKILNIFLFLVGIPINRTLDLFGKGDSLLVIFVDNKKFDHKPI